MFTAKVFIGTEAEGAKPTRTYVTNSGYYSNRGAFRGQSYVTASNHATEVPKRLTSARWHKLVSMCEDFTNRGVEYDVRYVLDADVPHAIVTAQV